MPSHYDLKTLVCDNVSIYCSVQVLAMIYKLLPLHCCTILALPGNSAIRTNYNSYKNTLSRIVHNVEEKRHFDTLTLYSGHRPISRAGGRLQWANKNVYRHVNTTAYDLKLNFQSSSITV
jgi:hypothetical protein